MLVFMILKQWTIWKNTNNIALFYINIPIRNIRISMMKINVTAHPEPMIAAKEFQHI